MYLCTKTKKSKNQKIKKNYGFFMVMVLDGSRLFSIQLEKPFFVNHIKLFFDYIIIANVNKTF